MTNEKTIWYNESSCIDNDQVIKPAKKRYNSDLRDYSWRDSKICTKMRMEIVRMHKHVYSYFFHLVNNHKIKVNEPHREYTISILTAFAKALPCKISRIRNSRKVWKNITTRRAGLSGKKLYVKKLQTITSN